MTGTAPSAVYVITVIELPSYQVDTLLADVSGVPLHLLQRLPSWFDVMLWHVTHHCDDAIQAHSVWQILIHVEAGHNGTGVGKACTG